MCGTQGLVTMFDVSMNVLFQTSLYLGLSSTGGRTDPSALSRSGPPLFVVLGS